MEKSVYVYVEIFTRNGSYVYTDVQSAQVFDTYAAAVDYCRRCRTALMNYDGYRVVESGEDSFTLHSQHDTVTGRVYRREILKGV
jgi:hypothetical protein